MTILNETAFSVGTMLWEDPQGRPRLTVILKGAFVIGPGGTVTAPDARPAILTADEHHRGDPAASVRFESDLVPFKTKADVVLVGRAHAPQGHPVTSLDASVRVGRLQKTIRVFGDRTWWFPTKLALVPDISEPAPFRTMDLVYERAYGGIDIEAALYCKENLVGRGFIGKKTRASVHGKPLPNLEDPLDLIRSWDSHPKPAGFGFYGRGWMPRLKHAGTYDELARPAGASAILHGFSPAFYNGAHPDLQAEGYLHGDEIVELRHVSPESLLRFRLPGLRPKITIARWTIPPEEWIDRNTEVALEQVPTVEDSVPAVLDTLILIPDEKLFFLVFRGGCPLAGLDAPEVARIRVTI